MFQNDKITSIHQSTNFRITTNPNSFKGNGKQNKTKEVGKC